MASTSTGRSRRIYRSINGSLTLAGSRLPARGTGSWPGLKELLTQHPYSGLLALITVRQKNAKLWRGRYPGRIPWPTLWRWRKQRLLRDKLMRKWIAKRVNRLRQQSRTSTSTSPQTPT